MKREDVFGILVKSVSLFTLLRGIADMASGYVLPAPPYKNSDYIVGNVPQVLLGLSCFLAADQIVKFAYPKPDEALDADNAGQP